MLRLLPTVLLTAGNGYQRSLQSKSQWVRAIPSNGQRQTYQATLKELRPRHIRITKISAVHLAICLFIHKVLRLC